MAERRVAEVMGQSDGLGQLRVQPQSTRDGARDLGHFDRMGQAGAKEIPFVLDKYLGFVLETTKGRSMDDPIPIALKGRAHGAFGLGHQTTTALRGIAGIGCGGWV